MGELIRSRQHQVACRALAPASTTRVILPPLGSLHLRLPLEVLLKEKPFIFHFPLLQLSVATRMLLPSGLSLLLFPVALPSSLLTSSQEAIEEAMSGVHAPAAAEGDQRLHLKLSVEAPSGASPLLPATRRI